MPLTKQAIKKVRQDKRKTIYNLRVKKAYKQAVSAFRKSPTLKGIVDVFSKLDMAAKTNIIHKNKAARLKSRLSKLIASKTPKAPKATASA
ncbi:hypothetical protein A3D07_03320 [Candidatus Curtissbacteria bacterium RIFCSPHIGHO2_02_FULL_42_15]|uniref:Small ribosomal subunit protein bS20 n=1 Tax=Candidatus Curtissbacteria bacterium RIFCSPHIGHO2_02_FULL_42_15 TaxID=1797716 RepID=A0A1F5GHB9_9BACT|nr:MAG: hypothetical protein A3D07_03320 [Candidatus Curtissbacteria bacterium RIFCSPHIGHO2_02_FULL_42_15]HLA03730.1 30S ribosomal protein S20 [Patescibacteria group bacterium]